MTSYPDFNREEMIECLKEFYDLYQHRPVKNNGGGMGPQHMFLTWYAVRKLNPSTIIESGTYKGAGTWMLEQAAPNATIHSIDPIPSISHSDSYRSDRVQYHFGEFADFYRIDWDSYIEDKENCLIFFDDHQNALIRILQCITRGFTKMMFEDNYPIGEGDCLSLKKVYEDDSISVFPGVVANELLDKLIKIYHELPPIFKHELTRWKKPWPLQTPSSLLKDVTHEYQKIYSDDRGYTWLCYVEIN